MVPSNRAVHEKIWHHFLVTFGAVDVTSSDDQISVFRHQLTVRSIGKWVSEHGESFIFQYKSLKIIDKLSEKMRKMRKMSDFFSSFSCFFFWKYHCFIMYLWSFLYKNGSLDFRIFFQRNFYYEGLNLRFRFRSLNLVQVQVQVQADSKSEPMHLNLNLNLRVWVEV